MLNQHAVPETAEWAVRQMTKIRSHQPQKVPASCEKINLGKKKVIEGVRSFAVVPFPMDDVCAFTKDATSFDHWMKGHSDVPNDVTANMFRKIWNIIMASTQQKNIGTLPYKKRELLSKTRYADFSKWAFNKNTGKPQSYSFVPGPIAEGGILVYDADVAAHLKHLEDNTMNLPPSSGRKNKKSQNEDEDEDEDEAGGSSDPVPPQPVKKTEPYLFPKFEVVLQPVRSSEDPSELGGFFLWIFNIDPNWSVDQGCHNFVNAVSTHKSEIRSRKFPTPFTAKSINVGLSSCIKELCAEDPEMITFDLSEWVNYCIMYDFAAQNCREKNDSSDKQNGDSNDVRADHLDSVEENMFELSDDNSEEDIVEQFNEKDYEESKTKIYAEYFRDPKSDTDRSFCNIFSLQKAIDIAKANGMDITDLVKKKVTIEKNNGTDTNRVILNAISTKNDRVENSVYYKSGRDEDFDCLYVMRKEDFFWSDSSSGTGLKYTNFPWVRQSESPIFRTVNIRYPKSMRRRQTVSKRNISAVLSQSSLNIPDGRAEDEESSSSPSQDQRKKQKTQQEDFRGTTSTRLITPLVTQRASLRGVDISQTTVCGKQFYVSHAHPRSLDGSQDKPAPTFVCSPDAKKDSITYLAEAFSNWRSSLAKYLETAKQQVERGKLLESPEEFDFNLIVPNRFMRDFYKERATFQNTAATHLLRLFKEGADCVMTVPGIKLGAFYLEHLHNKKITDRNSQLMYLYVNHDDFECDLFASAIKKQAFELRHTHEIITNWREFIIIYYGCLDIYRHEKDLHWCYFGSGEKGVGKSFLLERIKFLFVDGTVTYYFDASAKALLVNLSDSDWIIICDEMPPFLIGYGGLNKSGYTGESSVNSTKTAMTTGSREYRVFSFLDLPNGEKGRFSEVVSTPCVQCIMVACNVPDIDKALKDRFCVSTFADKVHAEKTKKVEQDEEDEDSDEDEVNIEDDSDEEERVGQAIANQYGNQEEVNPDGDPIDIGIIRSMNSLSIGHVGSRSKSHDAPISMMDVQSNIRATDRKKLLTVSKFGYSTRQTLHYVVEKAIAIGILPTPDMTLCSLLLTRVLKYLSQHTRDAPTMGLRSYARIVREARTMVISDAINNVYFSACRDRDVINEKTLLCVGPYLWCQIQHAIFAITLSMNQIIDPHKNAILFTAIQGCCGFPLKHFLKEKQKANSLKNNRSYLNDVEMDEPEASTPLVRRGGTGSQARANNDNDENMAEGASAEPFPDEVKILLDIYKTSRNDKNAPQIHWRTVREKEHNPAGGYDKFVAKIDLNYVRMTGSFAEFAQTAIQGKMKDKLSQADIYSFLQKMQNLRISVPHSIKPALADELLIGDSSLKLYENDREFNIFEFSKDNAGNESFRWDFCIHAIDKLGSGNNLIKSAIKDALEYAGLMKRPKLITGFPENQLQSGKFSYMKLRPNPTKPCFEIRSTSYQEQEIINILRFNETLVGDKQSLEEITSQLDESYTKSSIKVTKDIEIYMAERCLKNMGEPLVYCVDKTTGTKSLKWLFTNQNGEVEARDLPTAENQRIRNIYFIKNDITDMKDAHEDFMLKQHGKVEYPDMEYFSLLVNDSVLEKKKKSTEDSEPSSSSS